ncbi:MAG: DUF5069 domain-containing protein [Candidatus Eremiobacteraeota bacterium]|nr:DUF5069 domain-containing protein [Candidatus Eremiobacteraeota bacterium]
MEPLDLTKAPPRSPWMQMHGIYNMPRTIDKLRASLPGGNLGEYQMAGFSQRMFDGLGISEETLRQVVADAQDDADVERWMLANVDLAAYADGNEALAARKLGDTDREWFLTRYPVSAAMPDTTPLFDVIVADDREMFSRP